MSLFVMTLLATGPAGEVRAASALHREHLKQLAARGKLRLALELRDGEGFVEVYEVRDRIEGEAVAQASPLVEQGLAAWILRPCEEIVSPS